MPEPEPAAHAVLSGPYCGQCGAAAAEGDHRRCGERAAWEPPRFCASCRRRLVVQVMPRGWHGQCVEHGRASTTTV